MTLLSIEADAKTRKGSTVGVLTGVLYMAPSDVSGFNVCAMALRSDEEPDGIKSQCSRSCLFTAGRGRMQSVHNARIRRTILYFTDRAAFFAQLRTEIVALIKRAAKLHMTPAVRLDGTSDLGIARAIAHEFPDVMFYDYTKVIKRAMMARPENWHVTFSASEVTRDADVDMLLRMGTNVSVVFDVPKDQALPEFYNGHRVIDGDITDVRFMDPVGVIVGLRAKGSAKKDNSGFVRKVFPLAVAA